MDDCVRLRHAVVMPSDEPLTPVAAAGRRVFSVVIERVLPGCTLAVGERFDALEGPIVVGRERSVDLRLDDPTISKRHVEVTLGSEGFRFRSLTRRGTSFVNGKLLSPGEELSLTAEPHFVQIGRVLLAIEADPQTRPVSQQIPLPEAPSPPRRRALLKFRRRGNGVEVWCRGRALPIFPSAAKVLARLCEQPGETVTHDELDYAADPENYPRSGGASIAQLVTYARKTLEDAVESGWFEISELAAWLPPHLQPANDQTLVTREVLRATLENVRGVGYRIHLPRAQIEFV